MKTSNKSLRFKPGQPGTAQNSDLLLLSVVLSFKRVDAGVLRVHGEVPQGALAQR